MSFQIPVEKWTATVNEVTLGATSAEGGTRTSTVTVGGETTLPFLQFEGATPHPLAIAMEVLDVPPDDWPASLNEALGDVYADPAAWAKKCVEEHGADLICLRMLGANPEGRNASADECAAKVKAILGAVGVPLIIWGCGDPGKDNEIWPACSQAATGERCLLGTAVQENYKTITACAQADGHLIINEAPLDINIQKQVNILVTDMGFDPKRIIMYQTTGGLGYGIEYAYSIMERTRLAALSGDKMLSMPMLAVVGSEAWKVKEARLTEAEAPEWGPGQRRGIVWEAATGTTFVHGGCDIVLMRHPEAVRLVRETVEELSANGA